MNQSFLVRAALLVALVAVVDVVLSPLLTLGWVGLKFMILGVVVAVTGLRDLQALLLGFFGGVLTDALGSGLFGVGALTGICAAAVSVRIGGAMRRKRDARPFLARAVAVAVVVGDLLSLLALTLVGNHGPPPINYLLGGVVPDAFLNALLAYLIGGWLLNLITTKEERWA